MDSKSRLALYLKSNVPDQVQNANRSSITDQVDSVSYEQHRNLVNLFVLVSTDQYF